MKNNITYTKQEFKQALAYLILNCNFITNPGLFHGKMGCVLFFSYYARYTNNNLYNKISGNLLDEIYQVIHKGFPINFENGLCGIGWGIEYLIQNGFMKGNTDKILSEIDNVIIKTDLSKITDFSFRTGLAGITFYIIARLSSKRNNKSLPFDDLYLNNLKNILLDVDFSNSSETPINLVQTYINVLNKTLKIKQTIPTILYIPTIPITNNFQNYPITLENGIIGILLNTIINKKKYLINDTVINTKINDKYLIIFNEESKAANYGIGTYINELTSAIQTTNKLKIIIIHLRSKFANKTNVINFNKKNNITHIHIANIKNGYYNDWEKHNKLYYQNVIYLISNYLTDNQKYIFHINYMHMKDLAFVLKLQFPKSKIIITVHYTSWGLRLLGNKNKLIKELEQPIKSNTESIVLSIESEKKLLNICDRVITISKHSYNDLLSIYKISDEKLFLISHGIKDYYSLPTKEKKIKLKEKYGFSKNDQILIYAGRISSSKGVEILSKCFRLLTKEYSNLYLIICGDGNFNDVLINISPYWSKVVFTGFIDKKMLYEFYMISNIGILPSFHEEFGYVALEMMMIGLPLIVGRNSGLSELIINDYSGISIPFSQEEKDNNKNIYALKSSIKKLLDNPLLCEKFSNNGRDIFTKQYNIEKFISKMNFVYNFTK